MARSRCGRRASWPTRSTASAPAALTWWRTTEQQRSRQRAAAEDRTANTFGTVAARVRHRPQKNGRPGRAAGARRPACLGWSGRRRGRPRTHIEPQVIAGSLVATWAANPRWPRIDGHDVHAAVDEARKHGIPGFVTSQRRCFGSWWRSKMHGRIVGTVQVGAAASQGGRQSNPRCVAPRWAPPARERVLERRGDQTGSGARRRRSALRSGQRSSCCC